MNWPYDLNDLHKNTSDHYIIIQSTNLEKDVINKANTLISLAEQQSKYYYYYIDSQDINEVFQNYLNLVPQVSIKVNKHSKKDLDVILGFHSDTNLGTAINYM